MTRITLLPAVLVLALCLTACGGSGSSDDPPAEGALAVTSVTPGNGTAAGGLRVQIRGHGFSAGVTDVRFGRGAATDVSASGDTTINCTVPASKVTGFVTVSVSAGAETAALENAFLYNPPPQVWFVAPPAGPQGGGLTVSVVGLGFQQNDAGPPTVTFGASQAISIAVVNDTLIFATTTASQVAGAVDVTVTNANGADTLRSGFIYLGSGAKAAALLVPKIEGEPRLHALVADAEAGTATEYVVTNEAPGPWVAIESCPLAEGASRRAAMVRSRPRGSSPPAAGSRPRP